MFFAKIKNSIDKQEKIVYSIIVTIQKGVN